MEIYSSPVIGTFAFDTILVEVSQNGELSAECPDILSVYRQIKEENLLESGVFGTRVNGLRFENREYTKLIFTVFRAEETPRNRKLRYGRSAKEAARLRSKAVLYLPFSAADPCGIGYAAEGFLLGAYRFDRYFEKKESAGPAAFTILTERKIDEVLEKAKNKAQSVYTARDLSNEPSNILTPAALAKFADEYGRKYGFHVTLYREKEIAELGMNAFLAVSKGSSEAPVLIVMEYNGRPGDPEKLGFIGKGVCFDSGGYWLKNKEFMGHMKGDMEGAADVIGAMGAISKAALKINVVGVIAACENLISGTAYKPSDIIRSKSGKLIEVVNTDAEGRLTLADAITYAIQEKGVTKLVDIATLTGACAMALGDRFIGAFTNNEAFYQAAEQSAGLAGENIWRLPISEEYRHYNKSSIAPIKNAGSQMGGAIAAAMFIQEFVQELPWLHLDVAGASFSEADAEIFSPGATGSGTELLYEIANSFAE